VCNCSNILHNRKYSRLQVAFIVIRTNKMLFCWSVCWSPLHFPLAVMRTVQTHPDEGETVTGSDMSKTTLAPKAKAELISSTNPSLNTELITTQSKPLIPASTGTVWFPTLICCTTVSSNHINKLYLPGVPPSIPTAGFRFHAGSFVGGMALAVIITLAVALGYRLACSQREVRYRAMWVSSEEVWTGCSNASLSMRGRSRSSAEWMEVNGISPPEIHFSQDVIFCQVILKLHSKGRAKIIHSAENCIFKFTYLFKNPFKTVMTSHNSRMLACSGQQWPNL